MKKKSKHKKSQFVRQIEKEKNQIKVKHEKKQRNDESTQDEKKRGLREERCEKQRGENCHVSARNAKPTILRNGMEKRATKNLGLEGVVCVKMSYEVVLVTYGLMLGIGAILFI